MSGADKVAEKMEMTYDSENASIQATELGQSVLTLTEAMQTFDVESPMYNIKLPVSDVPCRTVVLRKSNVDIDGTEKLIIMVRDVTDKVRLE
jgi:hypothetical protein